MPSRSARTTTRCRRNAVIAASTLLSLALAACGGGDGDDGGAPTGTAVADTTTTTAEAVAATSTTAAPATPEAQAAAAYQASWDAAFRALDPPQETPELRELFTGEALSETLNIVHGLAREGHRVEGSMTAHPSLVSSSATQVVFDDCSVENSAEFDAGGTLVDPADNVPFHYIVTVVNENGTWKVSDFERLETACTPP